MAVAKQTSFLCNGYELAGFLKSHVPEAETEALDATVLANTYKSFEPGFKTGKLIAEGLFSADTVTDDDIDDVFKVAFDAGTNNVVTASLGVVVVGEPAIMLTGPQIKYEIPIVNGQLIMCNAEFQATDGIGFGYWLENSTLVAGSHNGTTVDNAVATANGGVLHVHLVNAAISPASDVDVKVQHSPNGSAWADLAGAAVNNPSATHASGSATVAPGTTVDRYTRTVSVVTGGNTSLVSAAFVRR